MDARQRLHAERLESFVVDDHDAGGAVGDLTGRRRGDAAAFLQQLHAANRFETRIEANTFVDAMQFFAAVGQRDLDRQHFGFERAALGGGDRALMTVECVLVEHVFRQVELLRHHLGAHELAELDVGIAFFHLRALRRAEAVLRRQLRGQAHRHAAHAFHARGDHHVHRARHHGLRGEVQRLLRRAALPVDARARHALRQLRSEDGVARDVAGLLADLADAAHDHVVDQRRVGVRALHQCIENLAGEIGRMPVGQPAGFAARGRAHGRDDVGSAHENSPLQECLPIDTIGLN